jgi:hypothetical protein
MNAPEHDLHDLTFHQSLWGEIEIIILSGIHLRLFFPVAKSAYRSAYIS